MNKLQFLGYLGVSGGILGVALVSLGLALPANLIWSFSNPMLAIYNYFIKDKKQLFMFAVYTPFAWFGVWFLW